MHPLKQALNLLKAETRLSLLLGGASLLVALISLRMAFFGAFLISLILLISPLYVWNWQTRKERQFPVKLLKQHGSSLLMLSLLTFPTGLLLGSSAGILQRTDQWLTSLPQAYFLIFLSFLFYAIIAQSLIFTVRDNLSISKALDLSLKGLGQQIVPLLGTCLVLAALLVPALFLAGLGLLIVCPIYYYAIYYFSLKVTD